MILPRLMIVTNSSMMRPNFSQALNAAVLGGGRLFQLREKGLSANSVLDLAQTSQEICAPANARLLINSDYGITRKVGAFGTHLRESQMLRVVRKTVEPEYSIGQSAHSLEAAIESEKGGADYLVFGSIFPTASHAGSTPIGLGVLREVAREISIPVFAIGGVSIENAAQCLEAGAHGVAVMRAVWNAADIETAVGRLNDVVGP